MRYSGYLAGWRWTLIALCSLALLACGGDADGGGGDGGGEPLGDIDVLAGVETNMQLTSSAFADGEGMPGVHSCYGIGTSPPISWSGVPAGTQSIALVVDEPNEKDSAHWVVYDLPPDVTELPGSISITQGEVSGGKQGRNDYNRRGWEGPCPKRGGDHEGSYVFNLYALDTMLGIDREGGARMNDVLRAMDGHVIGHGRLTALYCQTDGVGWDSVGKGSCPDREDSGE